MKIKFHRCVISGRLWFELWIGKKVYAIGFSPWKRGDRYRIVVGGDQ